jgi:hypothetical protein
VRRIVNFVGVKIFFQLFCKKCYSRIKYLYLFIINNSGDDDMKRGEIEGGSVAA